MKTIEVTLFATPPALPAARRAGLHLCPACGSALVHPVWWREAGPAHWEVTLRCPECQGATTGVYSQAAVEALDAELDYGAEALLHDLVRLSRSNREEEIARFAAALEADLLLPEDF